MSGQGVDHVVFEQSLKNLM